MDVKNIVCYSLDLYSQNCLAYLRLIGPLKRLSVNIINGIENGKSNVGRNHRRGYCIHSTQLSKEIPRLLEENHGDF